MRLSVLLSNLFFATAIVASPAGRSQRRAARSRLTHPLIPSKATKTVDFIESSNQSNIEYSSNWAGGVIEAPPSGHTFTAVSARFTVPTPTPPTSSGSGSWSGSGWAGIDGDTYGTAILQTGVDFTVTRSSSGALTRSYDAWYEWFPDYAYDFSLTVAAGNVVSLVVTSSSSKSGVATITNISTGKSVTKSLTSSSALGGQNAEWILEAYEENGSQVSLANFGTVEFTNAVAAYSGGGTEGPTAGTAIEIENSSGTVLTDVSLGSSTVTLTYE